MKYWITTDWHLNHGNIIVYESRPINYMELILKRHIEKIKPEDVLINLGDVIFARRKELKDFMEKISARKKILVRGNHDEQNTDTFYYEQGFDFVCDSLIIDYIQFSHAPMKISEDILCNVHGHYHTTGHRSEEPWYISSERHLLLSIEKENYYPVSLDSLKARILK